MNKTKLILICGLLTFVIFTSSAYSNNKKYEEGKIYRHKLGNEFVVLTMERHIAPYIYHQLTYNVGIQEGKPVEYFDKKADRILSVTKNDVIRVAKKYLTLDRFIIVIDGPIEQKEMD